MPAYDAFLLLSFGGPEGPDDVLPFLENVTRGRGVPRERLAEVAEHYYACGGVSPINAQCRDLLDAVGPAFAAGGIDLPLYWGNRNWHPFLEDTVRQMKADGVTRAIAFVTSAYSSYSACRQYLDDIDRAVAAAGSAHAGDHAGERCASTRSARTSTIPGSSSRSRPASRRHSPGCRPGPRRAPAWFSPRTASRRAWPPQRQPVHRHGGRRAAGGRYAAELREAPGLSPNGCVVAPSPSTWSSRAAAGRRACPGLSRT